MHANFIFILQLLQFSHATKRPQNIQTKQTRNILRIRPVRRATLCCCCCCCFCCWSCSLVVFVALSWRWFTVFFSVFFFYTLRALVFYDSHAAIKCRKFAMSVSVWVSEGVYGYVCGWEYTSVVNYAFKQISSWIAMRK